MNPFVKTLKKIAAAYNGVSLILRIAIGLVVGVILALVCPGATWLQELGNKSRCLEHHGSEDP